MLHLVRLLEFAVLLNTLLVVVKWTVALLMIWPEVLVGVFVLWIKCVSLLHWHHLNNIISTDVYH